MFFDCKSFEGYGLSDWNVSNVVEIDGMMPLPINQKTLLYVIV
jgi:hypothetical protein